MMLQLNPPIPVSTPKGKAMAHLVIDYGIEHDLLWCCFLDETAECWTFKNSDIRGQGNITLGRNIQKDISCLNLYEAKSGKAESLSDFTEGEYKVFATRQGDRWTFNLPMEELSSIESFFPGWVLSIREVSATNNTGEMLGKLVRKV